MSRHEHSGRYRPSKALEEMARERQQREARWRDEEREAQQEKAERNREFDHRGHMRVRPYALENIAERIPKWDPRQRWDVDTGKGFTRIYHTVLERLAHTQLSGPDHAIIDVVIRKTLGWNGKFQDRISITQFMEFTGLDKRTIQASLKRLRSVNVLLKLSEPTARKAAAWALNRQTSSWPVRQAVPLRKSPASVRYINAARRGGKIAPLRVRIVPRTIDKEQYKRIEMKKGNDFETATTTTTPRLKLRVIRKKR